MALGEPSTENLPRQTHQRGWANAQKHISLLPLARSTCAGLSTMIRTTCSAMTSEQAIELIGSAVDYSKQRSKLLASRERVSDAEAIRSEFEEWINPIGDCLPLMPCPRPEAN